MPSTITGRSPDTDTTGFTNHVFALIDRVEATAAREKKVQPGEPSQPQLNPDQSTGRVSTVSLPPRMSCLDAGDGTRSLRSSRNTNTRAGARASERGQYAIAPHDLRYIRNLGVKTGQTVGSAPIRSDSACSRFSP